MKVSRQLSIDSTRVYSQYICLSVAAAGYCLINISFLCCEECFKVDFDCIGQDGRRQVG